MFGSTLALFVRSLREDARLVRAHLLRGFLVGVVCFYLFEAHYGSAWFGAPGYVFFNSITYINFWFLTIAGVSYFATAITEEKEEMTLGLLQMAGVNRVSLLLGKSLPRVVSAMLLISAQFPFTLLAITLGGVTIHQIWAAYCALLAYTLLLANLGLLFSVLCLRSNAASWATALTVGVFLLVPWGAYTVLTDMTGSGQLNVNDPLTAASLFVSQALMDASVFNRIGSIMSTGFSEPAVTYQVVSNLVAAVVLFGLSWAAFARFAREEQAAAPARGFLFRRTSRLGWLGARRVWGNALVWKDFHFIAGGKPLLIAKLILYGLQAPLVGLLVEITDGFGWDSEDLGDWWMISMLVMFLIELAIYASRVFYDEAKWKTLSSVMLLPASVPAVAYSKVAGCLLGLAPSLFWFTVGAGLDFREFGNVLEDILSEPGGWCAIVQFLVFYHLVAFLSLYVKWGALPLAFAIVFFGNYFCLFLIFEAAGGPGDEDAVFAFLAFVGMVLIGGLQGGIGYRLRVVAAH